MKKLQIEQIRKRVALGFLVMMGAAFLSGCETDPGIMTAPPASHDIDIEKADNYVMAAKPTEREEAILSSITDQSFVLDFQVEDTVRYLSVWVEKYENGVLADDMISHIEAEAKEKGSIVFAIPRNVEDGKGATFHIGIQSDGAISSTREEDKSVDMTDLSSIWSFEEKQLLNEKENILGALCYSSKDQMSSLSGDFYQDPEEHVDELKKYDLVYLVKANIRK